MKKDKDTIDMFGLSASGVIKDIPDKNIEAHKATDETLESIPSEQFLKDRGLVILDKMQLEEIIEIERHVSIPKINHEAHVLICRVLSIIHTHDQSMQYGKDNSNMVLIRDIKSLKESLKRITAHAGQPKCISVDYEEVKKRLSTEYWAIK